jgi:hypothetical protein
VEEQVVRPGLRRSVLVTVLGVTLFSASIIPQAGSPLTPEEGAALEVKLAQITAYDPAGGPSPKPVTLYEREVNAYLRFQAAPSLPVGVTDPNLSLGDAGQVSARAAVDLNAMSSSEPQGALGLLRYLGGVVPVTASGILKAENGQGLLEVEAVTVGGIPVPVSVLQQLVRHYSKSETHPDGIDPSAPFALPHLIDEVRVTNGQAVVVR